MLLVGDELDVGLAITRRTWADDLPDPLTSNRSVRVFLVVKTSGNS
jgi:hypothetical protein